MITERELRARAYELSAGVYRPAEADRLIEELYRSGELLKLQDGTWTTRQLRELEEKTLDIAQRRASEIAAPVSDQALKQARRDIARHIKGSLTQEQREALDTITGPGGVTLIVGHAGSGKGVVLSTAARAWQLEGNEVIGTAVAGATAQRLKDEASLDRAYTADGLISGIEKGHIRIGPRTVVIMDEAAMGDHHRVSRLVELTGEREAKLLLAGDSAQLSSIGPGGLVKELEGRMPTAELTEVHRANHKWERQAWQQVRAGEPGPALTQYQAHDRLHIHDTRAQAAEAMVKNWDETRKTLGNGQAVMITDASNMERDQMNAMAQERRVDAGELGAHTVELPGKPYGLRAGDEIIFTGQYRVPGQQRIENGITGTILDASRDEDKVTVRTNEHEPREIEVDTSKFSDLSLSYAVHVHKGQGMTAETSGILVGGWQTDKEHAYVALSRAREQTQIYVSREDLGEQGFDTGAMERLAERMRRSRAQEASIAKKVAERGSERQQTAERQPRHEHTTERAPSREQDIDDFLVSRRRRSYDRSEDDDFIAPDQRDQPYHDRVQQDASERFVDYEQQPENIAVNIAEAEPRDISVDTREVEGIRVAYSTQLYDLNGHTSEPTYVLFGAWERGEEIGFIATTRDEHGHTHVHVETEERDGREIEAALTERIEEAIERSRSNEATNTRDATTEETHRDFYREPPQLNPASDIATDQPAIEPLEQASHLQPEPELIERDPYIEQAIQEERYRQQAFEKRIDNDRDNDRGFGIE